MVVFDPGGHATPRRGGGHQVRSEGGCRTTRRHPRPWSEPIQKPGTDPEGHDPVRSRRERRPVDVLVVGDVHGDWDSVDERFVEEGSQDVVVFVGDFGEEDAGLVARVAALRCEKVVLLGNHDAWWTMREARRGGRHVSDAVRGQLGSLGADHLAYGSRVVGGGRLLVVGGRPFSWGGIWAEDRWIFEELYGVSDDAASSDRIVEAAAEMPGLPILLVGHNGPTGLGEGRDAIYGRDFRKPFVDFGDADLRRAMDRLAATGRSVVGTVAGHMHHRLRGGGVRRRVVVDGGRVHCNASVVPRHERRDEGVGRHFLRLEIDDAVRSATDLWVGDDGAIARSAALHPVAP